jgi:hypothetical protein
VIFRIGIACAALQLLASVFAVQQEYDGLTSSSALLTLVWLAIPAAITLRWAYGLRDDAFVPQRVPITWAVATALQLVAYVVLEPGGAVRSILPTLLLVALVFLWSVWSGRRS